MKRWLGILLAIGLALFLAACGAPEADSTGDGATEALPPVAVVTAREVLADELGVGVESVAFGKWEPAEWSDSCLGLGGPAESCLQAITPGWRATFEVDGTTYTARTDELGQSVRIE